jgi:hypothetical protein
VRHLPGRGLGTAQCLQAPHLMKQVGILESRKDGLRILYWIKGPEVLTILEQADAILQPEVHEDKAAIRSD